MVIMHDQLDTLDMEGYYYKLKIAPGDNMMEKSVGIGSGTDLMDLTSNHTA